MDESAAALHSIQATCREVIDSIESRAGQNEQMDHVWRMAMQDHRVRLLWECVNLVAMAQTPRCVQEASRRFQNDVRFNSIVTVLAQFMEESEVSADDVRQALLVIERGQVPTKKKKHDDLWEQFIAAGIISDKPEEASSSAGLAAMANEIAESAKTGQIVCVPNERFDLTVAEVKDGTPVCYCPFCGHASMCLKEGPADHGRGLYYCNRECTQTPRAPTGFDFGGNRELFEASLVSREDSTLEVGRIENTAKQLVADGPDWECTISGTLRRNEAHIHSTPTAAAEAITGVQRPLIVEQFGKPATFSWTESEHQTRKAVEEFSRETTADYAESPANPDGCTCKTLMDGHHYGCPLAT